MELGDMTCWFILPFVLELESPAETKLRLAEGGMESRTGNLAVLSSFWAKIGPIETNNRVASKMIRFNGLILIRIQSHFSMHIELIVRYCQNPTCQKYSAYGCQQF